MVTHDPLAASYAHSALFLEDGQVVGRLDRRRRHDRRHDERARAMMMLRLSRQTVRHSWPPYVGALVALAFGVVLLGVAVNVWRAVERTGHTAGLTREDRAQLADLTSLFGIMSGVALFMAVFVVGSTFGFVVASRRRQLGLLRLVGATPRQVRRMVLGESAVVAVARGRGRLPAGDGRDAGLPRRARVARDPARRPGHSAPWLAWAVAAPSGVAVALLGTLALFQAGGPGLADGGVPGGRGRAAPAERVAAGHRLPLPGCRGDRNGAGDGAEPRLRPGHRHPDAGGRGARPLLPRRLDLPGPRLAGGAAVRGRDVSARLARDHVRTAVRTPVALAAPVLAISAIAGSMMVTLSFAADWVTALDREQLATPYVVETGGDARVGDRLAGLPLADPRITVTMNVTADNDDIDVDFVDPTTAPEARGMRVVKGDLADLDHGVAVTSSFAFDSGVHLGDQVLGARWSRSCATRPTSTRT